METSNIPLNSCSSATQPASELNVVNHTNIRTSRTNSDSLSRIFQRLKSTKLQYVLLTIIFLIFIFGLIKGILSNDREAIEESTKNLFKSITSILGQNQIQSLQRLPKPLMLRGEEEENRLTLTTESKISSAFTILPRTQVRLEASALSSENRRNLNLTSTGKK